jgi:hypothetical protein
MDVMTGAKVCPNVAKHTKCPTGYVQWHDWADRKMFTHKQVQCPSCGLYAIWIKKRKRR